MKNTKVYNEEKTKRVQIEKVWKIEENGKIVLEGNKQRINITVHSGLWGELPEEINKSSLVEKLIREYLENIKGKEIVLRKSIL